MDSHCPRIYHLFNNTALKVQTQEITTKESYCEKPKAKDPKPALPNIDMVESFKQDKKNQKNKKKIFQEKKKRDINTFIYRLNYIVKLRILAVIKKATILVTVPSQKTSVSLHNFRANN